MWELNFLSHLKFYLLHLYRILNNSTTDSTGQSLPHDCFLENHRKSLPWTCIRFLDPEVFYLFFPWQETVYRKRTRSSMPVFASINSCDNFSLIRFFLLLSLRIWGPIKEHKVAVAHNRAYFDDTSQVACKG